MADNRDIGAGREGERRDDPLEGHASSSTQTVEEPDIELGSAVHRRHTFSGMLNLVCGKVGITLFEVLVTPSDVELDRLRIPVEAALDYFPPLDGRKETYKEKIQISDPEKFDWHMTLTYDPVECFFIVYGKWQRFVVLNNLESQDVIRFYKPIPLSYDNHYQVEIVKRRRPDIIHEFKPENFLFEHPLTDLDILFQRLFMTKEEVSNRFPAVRMPAETHHIERLFFTDGANNKWIITIFHYEDVFRLLLEVFFAEHNLKEGDRIRFYRPVQPLHSRHFLIDFVKRVGDLTKSGTTDSTGEDVNLESNGRGGTNSGGTTQGDGGETTDDGGEGSRSGGSKWRKFCFGGCCKAGKGKGRTEEP